MNFPFVLYLTNPTEKISERRRTEIQQNDDSYIIQRMTFPVSERSSLSYHQQGFGAVRFLTAWEEKICYCVEVGVNFLNYVRFFHMYRTC